MSARKNPWMYRGGYTCGFFGALIFIHHQNLEFLATKPFFRSLLKKLLESLKEQGSDRSIWRSMKASLKSPLSLALAVVYLLWPLDLIPDILGPLGRIDDLLVLGLVIWQSYLRLRPPQGTRASQSNPPAGTTRPASIDPYALFNLPPGASRDEIEARYKELALQYHPDRAAHLGEELRILAHEKMVEVQQAYESLIKSASAA